MNYEEMSDFEINKRVAIAAGLDWSREPVQKIIHVHSGKGNVYVPFSPCNNPSDAWPIVVEKRITLKPYDDKNSGWFATTDTSFFVDHMNPLRAAMIVFLMMQEKAK